MINYVITVTTPLPPSIPDVVVAVVFSLTSAHTFASAHQPQFSSTPFGNSSSHQQQEPHGRHVLGSLGSQENISKQQVLFKGGKKTVLSPLSEHAHVAAGGMAIGEGITHSEKCNES